MISPPYNLDNADACARYHALWEEAPERTVFASLRYARAVDEAYGLGSSTHFSGDDAALLLHTKGRGPLRRVIVPPSTQYSAVLLGKPALAHQVHGQATPLDHLLKHAEQQAQCADLLVKLHDPRTAQWRGWDVRPLFTYMIDLPSNIEDWSEGARRTWRSKTSSYRIEEDPRHLRTVIDLCVKSYERHERRMPGRPAALETVATAMGPWARPFVAIRNGTVEGGVVILHDDRTAHYWIAGSIPGPAMTVLIGEVLTILHTSGIAKFDFVGANTPSIAEFKRTFGPVLTQYYHLRRRPQIHFLR
ncbi:MAG: GNAT family N-acetyltransferase [Rhodothermaceae bacterium]|nr:GNAT family N-acetyltransferase [Rhodothermaceae bacterium]MXX59494.1 GNAT family N-acetyltransferase [Rhodothermaceae bacterium]MYD19234.1 GNAT family N-acetyltransferase [Rhodothermaceae bacterium]MYD56872.1 GNAT family N-acetyltransferase [Rhodothermaceae bacterium]MYI43736.1 GNAT family N-acetyltransferase [Rhodothermaceae bacterium]